MILALILSLAATGSVVANAAEPIAVAVAGGRIFTGQVDSHSDDSLLQLRIDRPGITLRRSIAWNQIDLAQVGDQQLSSEQLYAKLGELKTTSAENDSNETAPAQDQTATQKNQPEEIPTPIQQAPVPNNSTAHYIAASRARNTSIAWISIDAQVAHFGPTVETTGIILHLYPMDDTGRVVPVDGTLNVELIAGQSYVPRTGSSLPRIGSWAVRVTPDQFGPAGAIIKLSFQAPQPDFDLRLGPYGLVHARLSLPGNGSFEASQGMLRIRPYSAVRDQQQQTNGDRYFDVESVNSWGD